MFFSFDLTTDRSLTQVFSRYFKISEYTFQNMKEIVQRKSENMDPSNQQTKLSMLRCRLASDWSEIVKNMSYSDFISYYSL